MLNNDKMIMMNHILLKKNWKNETKMKNIKSMNFEDNYSKEIWFIIMINY